MKNTKGKVITITSSKGGVGKTIFATNLAGVFEHLKKKTLLIDMDLSCGGISVLLNLEKSKTIYNLFDDILNNRFKNIDDYIYHYSEYIDIIPSCKDPRQGNKIDSKIIEQIVNTYKGNYEVVIIDTIHVPVLATLVAIDISDIVLYMVTDNIQDLKNTSSMLAILDDMKKDNIKVVLNNSCRFEKNYFSKFDIKNIIKNNLDYILPSSMYISNINKYIMDGKILVLNNKLSFKNNGDRELLIKIANSLIGDNDEK